MVPEPVIVTLDDILMTGRAACDEIIQSVLETNPVSYIIIIEAVLLI